MGDLFDFLAPDSRFDLLVHYLYPASEPHPWQGDFTEKHPHLFSRRFLGLDWHLLRLVMQEKHSHFLFTQWNETSSELAILLAILFRRSYSMLNDMPDPQKQRNLVKATSRSFLLSVFFRCCRFTLGTGMPALAALERLGCPERKLVNFPCFLNLDRFPARKGMIHPPGQPLVFFSSGRLVKQKGYDLALSALAHVFQQCPESFRYILAGVGAEQESLRKQAKALGIGAQVHFLGWLEPETLQQQYDQADIFLHPARFEPFGVSILEAMASGMVVIGSDATAAVADRINDGENGFVHEVGSEQSLIAKLQYVVQHREQLDPVCRAARKTAEEWPLSRAALILQDCLAEE